MDWRLQLQQAEHVSMHFVQRLASSSQACASPRCEGPVPAARSRLHGSQQRQQQQGIRRQSHQSCTTISHQLNRNAELEALLYPPSSSPPSPPSSSNPDPSSVKVVYPIKCLDWEREEINAHFDILGIAQSMVDVTTDECCDDRLLEELGVKKGGRRVLGTVEERSQVLNLLEEAGISTQITAGGSLANTLVGIGRLSAAYTATASRPPGSFPPPSPSPLPTGLNVALGTSCSSDALGQFFSSQLSSAGVTLVPTHEQPSATSPGAAAPSSAPDHIGTVFVLASPDAQRSFLSFFTAEPMSLSSPLRTAITQARLVVVEGYLWELPRAAESIAAVLAAARAGGAQVALTAGDAGVVARNREAILKVLQDGGHHILFFANCEEACELLGRGSSCSARSAAQALGSLCSIAVVTDGRSGSHISYLGNVASLPPAPVPRGVRDTCGAGDAYAAGFCYALMMGYDCLVAGAFASHAAVCVISRHGAQLHEEEALELVQLLEQLAPRSRRTPSWPASFESTFPLNPNASVS